MAQYLSDTKSILIFFSLLGVTIGMMAQEEVNCDSVFYTKSLNGELDQVFSGYIPEGDKSIEFLEFGELTISINLDSLLEKKHPVKVWVEFVVDTLGYAHCPKVVSSECDDLNGYAITFIKESKLLPALKNGKKVVSSTIFPVFFKSRH